MATKTRTEDTAATRPAWPSDDTESIDLTERSERSERSERDIGRLEAHEDHRAEHRAPRKGSQLLHTIRISLATLLVAAIAVFAAVNTADIDVDFVTDTGTVPMWSLIACTSGAGFVLGRVLPHARRR